MVNSEYMILYLLVFHHFYTDLTDGACIPMMDTGQYVMRRSYGFSTNNYKISNKVWVQK